MALTGIYGNGLTDDKAREQLHKAINAGITLLDTADVNGAPRLDHAKGPSGTNEEMLALLLAKHRNEVQISTKFGITGEQVDLETGKIEAVN